MISSLQKQLLEEKEARARLEGELQNLKVISQDIALKLDNKDKKRYHWDQFSRSLWKSTIEWI